MKIANVQAVLHAQAVVSELFESGLVKVPGFALGKYQLQTLGSIKSSEPVYGDA